jgi:hypothetical protein
MTPALDTLPQADELAPRLRMWLPIFIFFAFFSPRVRNSRHLWFADDSIRSRFAHGRMFVLVKISNALTPDRATR